MDVKRCDRCGNHYVPDHTLRRPELRLDDKRLMSLGVLRYADLCLDCCSSLWAWWDLHEQAPVDGENTTME